MRFLFLERPRVVGLDVLECPDGLSDWRGMASNRRHGALWPHACDAATTQAIVRIERVNVMKLPFAISGFAQAHFLQPSGEPVSTAPESSTPPV